MITCLREEMLVTHKSFVFKGIDPYLLFMKNDRRFVITNMTKRKDLPETSRIRQQPIFPPIKVPNTILARSVVAVFGLGFIDAGYSGDWSRIGVISKEAEDLLKIAAFVIVPLCIFLIFSFSKEPAETET